FGARALRRPLTSDEIDFYKTATGSSTTASAAAYADLIGLFVTAPELMYFVEHGDTAVAGQPNVYDVSPFELASRLSYQLWQTAPLTSDLSFARDARLAKVYGVAAWSGTGAPPMLPAGQRPGLLTRALFVSTGTANTRPIMKGVFLRTNVLCDAIPPPPPGANAKPPDLGPNVTTRESVEAITEMPGTICVGCHGTAINPLGFATEGFDALGRFRTAQRLFDATGAETGTKPVDTMAVPQVVAGDQTAVATPAELMSLLLAS